MSLQRHLEEKYSIVLADYAPAEIREQLEQDLISELMQEIPGSVGIELEYMGDRIHRWLLSDDGSIDGIFSTCSWNDGMLDSSLTFLKFEKEGENANQTST